MIPGNSQAPTDEQRSPRRQRPRWVGYAVTMAMEAALTGLLLLLLPVFPMGHYPIPYVLLTMAVAYLFSEGPAILSIFLGWFLFTYFFVPPEGIAWPLVDTTEGAAQQVALLLGVIVVGAAMIQARKSNRRIQGLADEAVALNASLMDEIEERTLAQDTVLKEAAFSESAINSMPGVFYLFDRNGKFLRWNRNLEEVSGYSSEEISAMHPQSFFLPEDKGIIADAIGQAFTEGHTNVEAHLVSKSGGKTPYYFTGSLMFVDNVPYLIGSGIDIGQRKRAEEALRESEERFRVMADSIPQLAWMANADGYIFWYNQRWYEYTGTTPEQMEGWGWQSVHDPELLPSVMERWKASIATGRPFEMEFPLLRADGEFRWFLTRGVPIRDSEGRVWRWFGTNTDIGEKREAEEEIRRLNAELEQRVVERTSQLTDAVAKLDRAFEQERAARTIADAAEAKARQLLEMAPDGIIIADKNGSITFANDQAAEMFACERDEFLGKLVEEFIPQRYREAHVEHRAEYAANPRTRQMGVGLELYGLRKDGTEFPVEIALSPTWTDGELSVTAIIRDVTQRKLVEEQVKKLNDDLSLRAEELETANKELEAFSYSVSHDLRAPLRAIDGFSNTLLKKYNDSLDERGQDYLNRVRAAAVRMGQLIDDILGLSRATRAEMHRQSVDMSEMALEILGELRNSEPKRKAEFVIAPNLVANADSHLLRIVLDNLLGNAWKFTSNRDVANIQLGSTELSGEWVYFIKDNGAGFNPAYAEKLFSPFQRLHTESEFAGTGIGLALVQRILRRHGGRIWAESSVDEGATFYFTLGEENRS